MKCQHRLHSQQKDPSDRVYTFVTRNCDVPEIKRIKATKLQNYKFKTKSEH